MEIVLKIDNFEGPLDLLLHLIDKKKLKISEIKISQIIDDYLLYLEEAKEDSLEIKVEFLVIACELLEIKAFSLLSMNKEEEKEKLLKQKLEDYKLFKELAEEIGKIENEYNLSYSRGEGKKIVKKASEDYDITKLKLQDIYDLYNKYLNKLETEILEIEFEKRYSLTEEMDRIHMSLFNGEKSMEQMFVRAENRTHLVYIFLAILDLYRDGVIDIDENYSLKLYKN
ncbi:MAG: ScpA family protein [Cetobacterium sp.]|uniref:segregation and condensation protein A n=1 Tax=unclassified Cetobacterium TaxID=2630983 RepID=UPI00163BE1A1|nr:ScpA family protein [Cetobacterium sp. 2A]MBC2855702.1 segregation/condensation protein A [Cetobacterium sp. 2A]